MPQQTDHIFYLGTTNFRDDYRRFGIKQKDLASHMLLLGKTGVGKSTLLSYLLRQHVAYGAGCAVLDPHGDVAEQFIHDLPSSIAHRVVYLNTADPHQLYGYNPIVRVPTVQQGLVASGIMSVFKKQWTDAWGVRMEHILRNALLTLLEQPSATLADLARLFIDDAYRREALSKLKNDQVRLFWEKEYARYNPRIRTEAIAPILNKVGAFLANPLVNRILTAPQYPLRLRTLMDENQVVVVNLSKGRLGEDASNLLGGLFVTAFGLAALSRASIPESERQPFTLMVDEFHAFATESFISLAAELRKYGLSLVLAQQYLHQVDTDIRDAVLGNVGTLLVFRIGHRDAAFLEQDFSPHFSHNDMTRLPNHAFVVTLMIDGMLSLPFTAKTLPPHAWEPFFGGRSVDTRYTQGG